MNRNILAPWQEDFVRWALAPQRAPISELQAPIGSGKSVALLALAESVAGSINGARILIACPSLLILHQYREMLRELGIDASFPVHMYSGQLALEDSSSVIERLAQPGITLATFSLIRRLINRDDDVPLKWDLIVADGNISPRSLIRAFFLSELRAGRIRRLVLTGISDFTDAPDNEARSNVERFVMHVPSTWPSNRLFTPIEFARSEAEERVFASIRRLARAGSPLRERLDRALASSVAAVEQVLLQMRNAIAHDGELRAFQYDGPTAEFTEEGSSRDQSLSSADFASRLFTALRELYELDEDSKFNALRDFVLSRGAKNIAIAASFKATEEFVRSILSQEPQIDAVIPVTELMDIKSLPLGSVFVIYDSDAPGIDLLGRVDHHELPKEMVVMTPLGVSLLPAQR